MATIRMMGLMSGVDTESIIKQLSQKYQTKIDKASQKQTLTENKMTAWSALNSKIYSFYTGSLSQMKFSTGYSATTSKSNSDALSVSGDMPVGTSHVKINEMATTGSITGAKLDSNVTKNTKVSELGLSVGTYKFNGKDITIDEDTTLEQAMSKLNLCGVNANFDEGQHRIYITAKGTGADADFKLEEEYSNQSLLGAFGIPPQTFLKDGKYYTDSSCTSVISDEDRLGRIKAGDVAVRIIGADASLTLNGVEYTSSSNTFSINGGTYTINKRTDENITITTAKDNSKLLDNIKGLVEQYNSIITEMSKAYNTSNDGYKPLTESQRDSMTEAEIKKWDEKVENSSLYKDSRLYEVMNVLKSVMSQGVEMSDGSKMYLFDFGLNTGNYFETERDQRGAYIIDEKKLQSMIETNPEKVEEFFKGLSNKLYNTLTTEMGSSDYSSMYKIYNDKQLSKEKESYIKEVSKYEEQMAKYEEKYYRQFAQMEKMLAQLNSQTNTMSSLFNFYM